jgi:hypothetical protein
MNGKLRPCAWIFLFIGALICGPAASSLAQDTTLVQEAAAPAFPDVIIPGVPPTGTCCLWRVHKRAPQGQRIVQFGTPYQCPTGQTVRGNTTFRLPLVSEGPPCDQGNFIPNNSVLEATGNTIKRADGFAHFFGEFTIINPNNQVLFKGTMEAIDRIGTHHPPFGNEACNQQGHLEGWLVGRGVQQLQNLTLRALIVARASLPTGTAPAPVFASIDGVIIRCP